MLVVLSWLGDVLNAARSLHKLQQLYSMHVVCLVDVYVEVATHDHGTCYVRFELFEDRAAVHQSMTPVSGGSPAA